MMKRFRTLLESHQNFAFETTGAATTYIKYLHKAHALGYKINLLFLWLSSPEQAIQRVASRVKQGGHNIPKIDVQRRYFRGLKNLINFYLPIADTVLIIDNSYSESNSNKIIARKNLHHPLIIEDEEIWKNIERSANVYS